MKKVSTVAARQSSDISQRKLTIRLDLGDRNSWYCVPDESARIQLEHRVRTTAKALSEVPAPCHTAGSHWKSERIHPGSSC